MVRALLGLLGLFLFPGLAAAEEAPRRYTIEQLMAADSFGGFSFSPDNSKLLFTSNRTGGSPLAAAKISAAQFAVVRSATTLVDPGGTGSPS